MAIKYEGDIYNQGPKPHADTLMPLWFQDEIPSIRDQENGFVAECREDQDAIFLCHAANRFHSMLEMLMRSAGYLERLGGYHGTMIGMIEDEIRLAIKEQVPRELKEGA